MVNLLVRDVPDDVHRELVRRAEAGGQSLQQSLVRSLRQIVERPTLDDLLKAVEGRRGGHVGLAQAVDDLTAERGRG